MHKASRRLIGVAVIAAALALSSVISATADDGRPEGATPGPAPAEVFEAPEPFTGWDGDGPAPRVLHAGNVTTDGSHCIGGSCNTDPPSPNYGFDTLRLMEDNLRILAMDGSGGSFPTRDWQIEFNSSSNGGPSYYMVRDCGNTAATSSTCNGTAQFTIEAGADNDSIYVDSSGNQGGNVGFGTTSPAVDLHALSGNSPTLRLEQDPSSGFGPQSWDVAGNEAGFFIRDVTNGSSLPLRIEPGVASNTLYLDGDERIGMGTSAPLAPLHLRRTDGSAQILVTEENGTVAARELFRLENNGSVRFQLKDNAASILWQFQIGNNGAFAISRQGTGGPEFQVFEDGSMAVGAGNTQQLFLDADGNLTVTGDITANGTLITPTLAGEDQAVRDQVTGLAAENEKLRDRVDDLETRLAAMEALLAQLADG